ncbi:long-chain-fatty-acid-- ligase ACSBG2 [Brachionus plicatilis]|uniref:long-chain-fatty-acid--CoA ligase n=1 Tax=Brachionus plicatilis TaxID=10195 RepID=A0A3M7PLW7_BRAPC|nr:long-chain-fatty-acid-- ligase ACSBG2 [Brachionus plicatilis]
MIDEIETIRDVWKDGPDTLCPADSYFSSSLDQPVLLRQGTDKYKPMSIYTMFKNLIDENPFHYALAYKKNLNDDWIKITFNDYWKMCHRAAKSFIQLGLQPSECVCILGFNAPQWFIAHLGAIIAGGVGCGIYTTNSVEQIEFILKDCKAKIVVVENAALLKKVVNCSKSLEISKIIQYSGEVENTHVLSWNEFMEHGIDVCDSDLSFREKTLAPNKCASLIYTSGTTGNPKAAMISHDNITYLVRYMCGASFLKKYEERFISYLPLSHIAAQLLDIFAPLNLGITVYFAQPDALKGSLNDTMRQVRPTYFFGVPRVWEKIQEKVQSNLNNLTGIKLSLFQWAQKVASQKIKASFKGESSICDPSFVAAKILVLNKVHKLLGLDKCRVFYSGAAPITKETLDFFINLGIPLCEVYGMSESTGPHSIGTAVANKVTSVGLLRQFNRSKLREKNAEGCGELLISGRHVFMGYLNDEEKTKEAFESEEWLRTGDEAKIINNYIFITGRLKEIIITAGGENIAPVPIEDNLKNELPSLISNCMLIGDKKKYLVILITLKCKLNPETGEPLDELNTECINYLESINSTSKNITDIIDNKDPIVYKAIEEGLKNANKKAPSRAANIQKFFILPRDFSLANGELGPTLKLRRPIVAKMYTDVIESLYKDN